MRGTGTTQHCDRAVRAVSTWRAWRRDASARRGARERHDASHSLRLHRRRGTRLAHRLRFAADRPAGRALAAVDAAQEHLAGLAPHAVIVASRQVAVEQIPHKNLEQKVRALARIAKAV